MNRRAFLATTTTAASAAAFAQAPARKGRLKQGVCLSVFGRNSSMTLEEKARHASRLGCVCMDLLKTEEDWRIARKYGLVPEVVPGAGTIPQGFNRKENHARMEAQFRENIAKAAAAGIPTVITFSGNRAGISDEEGLDNSVILLNKVKAIAEDKGVTICMELLNSKVNHKDYQGDHTAWGVELAKRVGSPRFKLLYDIYHMQIMEGDIIRTIRDNIDYIGHFHTAGNPGRHELNGDQELNYHAIAKAIADLNFQGTFSHEYSPLGDPLASLEAALQICDV